MVFGFQLTVTFQVLLSGYKRFPLPHSLFKAVQLLDSFMNGLPLEASR